VVVISSERKADTLLIKGLRDPLTPSLNSFAEKHGFTGDTVQFHMAFYQSLDPSLAMLRAALLLDAPETVKLSTQGQQLVVSGTAMQPWIDFVVRMKNRIPGFNTLNLDQLTVDDSSRLLLIRQQLQAPQTVQLRLDNNRLFVSGTAPAAWINNLNNKSVLLHPELRLIKNDQSTHLQSNESLQAVALQQALDGVSFYFSEGSALKTSQQGQMQAQLKQVSQLLALITVINTNVSFVVKGYTDAVGDATYNQMLRLKRAEVIKQLLVQSGASPASISSVAGLATVETKQSDVILRRVDLQVRLINVE
jgi:outer membrane protein OmpA-like peptidoglycan-associated protein